MRDFFDQLEGISGSGGGGGKMGGGGAEEADNTLRSKAKARLIEILGEGRIEGPAKDGLQWIYFDTTPVENPNGSFNFKGVSRQVRYGLADQDYLKNFTMTEQPVQVETEVKFNETAPIRQINDRNADAVRFIIRIPALAEQDDEGTLKGASVSYSIDVQVPGASWVEKVKVDITNQKTTSPYQKAHRVELPDSVDGVWNLRVRRRTPDSEKVELQNETWWESYTILTEGKFSYPNTALVAMELDAEQFGSNIPERSYHIKGLRILVPTNYNPITREYSGIWDGSFKRVWSNNPAWVLYDLLTNDRYGLGEFIDATKVDKWSLYQIAQYCDQKVPSGYHNPDGSNIMEPRFTFNGVINTRDDAYKVLQTVTTAFRGMAYWSYGQVYASADMPQDPVKLITPSNVIGGHFKYSGTSMKARHSVALVGWNDPTDHYRSAIEYVENAEQLAKFGYRPLEMQAVGCTSRGQAHRYGKWALDTEQHETETAEWEASWDQADLKPGQIVLIADPKKAQVRLGGRLLTATGNRFTLDKGFIPKPGESYVLYVVMPDGKVESRAIAAWDLPDADGGYTEIRTALSFPQVAVKGAQWVITGTDVAPRRFRVMSVTETDKHLFKITALFNDPTKYARVELDIKLPQIPYTRPQDLIKAPTNLTAVESLYWRNGQAKSRISLSWTPSDDFMAAGYLISAQSPRDGFVSFGQVASTSLDIEDAAAGKWIFYVSAVSRTSKTSSPAALEFNARGWEGAGAPYVSHLELYGRGSSTEFAGRDARFVWRNNFPGSSYETGTGTAGAGNVNPFYRDNVIRVFDVETGRLVRTEAILTNDYTYSFDKNVQDFRTIGKSAQRKFRFEVTVRDTLGRESSPAVLTVENPVPDLIIPKLWTNNSGALYVDYPFPDDLDFAGGLVWASRAPNFDPYATSPVYDGPNNFVSIPLEEFATYYIRFAAYDSFGKVGLNISPEVEMTMSGIVVDNTPPAIPTGLALASKVERASDGVISATLTATWAKSPSENFSTFEVEIKRGAGDWIGFVTSGDPKAENATYVWSGLALNETYTVRVKARSRNGVASGYSTEVSHKTPLNTVKPGAPTNLTATASLKSAYLKWANPSDPDLSVVEIWSSTTNNIADALLVGTSAGIAFTHAGIATNVTRYYWVRSVNTSALQSNFSAVASVTPGQVAEGDIAANAITADKIQAGAIEGEHLNINTSLPPTITIGKTGVSIGATTEPGKLINSQTTKIDPGQILIAGDVSLASWRDGTDLTKIRGGSIAANSISANQLEVGLRGITVSGLQFSYNKETNQVSWSSGTIEYIGDDGKMKVDAISASSKTWAAGTVIYFVWTRGTTALSTPTTPPAGADQIILGTYRGGVDLNMTYGRTMIDGNQIRTGSLTADLVAAGEFITDKAQIKGGIIENTHLAGYITFDKLAGGTLSAADKIRVGGDRFVLWAPGQNLNIYDAQPIGVLPGELSAGRLRVRLGKLGEGTTDYGLQMFDANGTYIFGTGGFGASVIPNHAIASLDTSKLSGSIDKSRTTGFGAMSAVDYIGAHNIGTYIAGAAIGNAYIADLHGDKIHVNSLHGNRIQAESITADKVTTGVLITRSAQIGHAVIDEANIGVATIGTLRLKNSAISTMAAVSGRADSRAGSGIAVNVYCRQGGKCVVIASHAGGQVNGTNPGVTTFNLYVDNVLQSGSMVASSATVTYTNVYGENISTTFIYPITHQWIINNPNEETKTFRLHCPNSDRAMGAVMTVLEFAR